MANTMIGKGLTTYISQVNKDDTGKFSSSHLWFHIVNAAIVSAYLYVVFMAAKLVPIPLEGLTFLTLVISGLITGNKLAQKFMNMRFGTTNPVEEKKDAAK